MPRLVFVAAVVALAGLALIVRRSRRGGTATPEVLAAFPLAVLLLVTPIPIESFATISAFRAVAESGRGGVPLVANVSNGMSRALLTGALGFMTVILAAGITASFAEPPDEPAGAAHVGAGAVPPRSETSPMRWLPAAAAVLLFLPAAVLCLVMARAVPPVVEYGLAVASQTPASTLTEEHARQVSGTLASRLTFGLLAGTAVAFLALLVAMVTLALPGTGIPPAGVERFARGLLAVSLLAGVVYAAMVASQFSSIGRLTA